MVSNIMKVRLSEFDFREELKIYVHPEHTKFEYSDGNAAEESLLDILCNTTDVSLFSEELSSRVNNWVTEYHFSDARHNLLRHINFAKGNKILELGAGCGAITRFLGQTECEVTSIEGSLRRAQIARERCRDLDNVDIYCSNFNDAYFDDKYDFVTLIGVLEYSPAFFDSEAPVIECLKLARKALKPNGQLLIAIENRLGLKYFAGCPEDHLSEQYVGIEDLYKEKGVCTFGKKELTNLISSSGFAKVEFQYPFPDYKLPQLILFEEAFHSDDFRPDELACQLLSRDYSGKFDKAFDDRLVWRALSNNSLMLDMSNSFLVIASGIECKSGIDKRHENVDLAVFYTTNRKPEYNTKTAFIREKGACNIYVKKTKLCHNNKNKSDVRLMHSLPESDYVSGENLETLILRSIKQDDWDAFLRMLNIWVNYVLEHGIHGAKSENSLSSIIASEFIDCIPNNIILKNGVPYLIDTEWALNPGCTVGALLFRYLVKYSYEKPLRDFLDKYLPHKKNRIFELLNMLSLQADYITANEFIEVHNQITKTVYGNTNLMRPNSAEQVFPSYIDLDAIEDPPTLNLFKRIYWRVLSLGKKALKQIVNKMVGSIR